MSPADQASSPNLLVGAMTPGDFALISPHLERVSLEQQQTVALPDQPIEHVYFPEGGITSITSEGQNGRKTEVGIVGREGFAGIAVLLGAGQSPHHTFVQVGGSSALRIGAAEFLEVVAQSPSLQALLLRYVQTFLIQSAHSTVANAQHSLESRLARWLLMCHDRMEEDEFRLTHEFMSMMIAAQRTGVTVCLHILEGAGLIRSKRSRVIILDREGLTDLADGAYGTPEAEYCRLIGPFGRGGGA